MARYYDFYRVGSVGNHGWICPDIRAAAGGEDGKTLLVPSDDISVWGQVLMVTACAGLVICLWLLRSQMKSDENKRKAWLTNILDISFFVFLRWLLLLIMVLGVKNIICSAADDPGYFRTAIGFLNWDFSGKWSYTIGHGFFYMPFILLTGAKEYYDIAVYFSWFSGFIIMPAILGMFYLVIKKLTSSRFISFTATMMWSLIPFIYHYSQDWDRHIYKSFCALPSLAPGFRHYSILISTGFNGMSDCVAAMLIMLVIMLCLYLQPKNRSLFLISGIYAFACLVRINNIFYSPLIAWLFWLKMKDQFIGIKPILKAAIPSVVVFLVVFAPQFIVNHIQFGSCFTFPYIMHENAANDGFEYRMLHHNITFLGNINHAVWSLGTVGMLFIKDKIKRTTLVLWTVPSILFFFGYTCTSYDGVRFILPTYGAMYAAFVCCEVWQAVSSAQRKWLIGMIVISLLYVCPSGYNWEYLLPWDMQRLEWGPQFISVINILVPIGALAVTLAFFRNKYLFGFALVFVIIFFPGTPYTFVAAFCIALLRAIWDWLTDIKPIFTTVATCK
jgi:hypothetical protein